MAGQKLWFVRRNGQVKGPFMSAQITRNILLGRLNPNDELSSDEQHWQQVSMYAELYPDVMQGVSVNEESVNIAKMQVDERISDQRRERQNMEQERRRTRDRRETETDAVLQHRKHRKELDDVFKNRRSNPKMPFLSVFLIVIVIVSFAVLFKAENNKLEADCTLAPTVGVNWSNCKFIDLDLENKNLETAILNDAILNESNLLGVNLSGSDMAYVEMIKSDLSYANLGNARLIGANLQHADLRYASLKNADLSYADLSNALLAGADLSNAKLDDAIWVDGQKCKKSSIGICR